MTTDRQRPIKIEEEMRSSYLDYAMSVIVSRALPDVRDGLKPVQRRILYAMHELGFRPNSAYRKSARLVGEVLGKYHPHGDSAVYDAMVRMAQDFSTRYPLVDGQGNFGSIDRDPPAAMRYTEVRLAAISEEVLANIEQDTVDFAANFDDSVREPTVLPARLPNLLVNGSEGIAVGMATSIPPHNLTEICNGIQFMIDHPDATLEQVMKLVPAPDFPTGGILLVKDKDDIKNAYSTGHGRIILRCRAEIEETDKGRKLQIVITELPYQVNKAALVERIAGLAKDRKIEGVADVRDESDRQGMRVLVELRREAQPQQVLNSLYKHTAMQAPIYINMLALVDGQPKVVPLMDSIKLYIDFRVTVIRRRSEFELKRAKDRAHILEGLKIALDSLDQAIDLIRKAPSAEGARGQLMERFSLTQIQAQAILDMQLRRLAALERQRILDEYDEVQRVIASLEGLLASPEKVLAVVKEETKTLKKNHGDTRRTEISAEAIRDWTPEETEQHRDMAIILSQRNYIKRLAANLYRPQRRAGKGMIGVGTRGEDAISRLAGADTHDFVLFLSSNGKLFARKVYELPEDRTRTARGIPLVNFLNLAAGETITAMLPVPSLREDRYLGMVTRRGLVKRTLLSSFASLRSRGMWAMRLNPGDEIVAAQVLAEEDDIVIVSRLGFSATFEAKGLRSRSRTAGGVRGIRLFDQGDEHDEVVAAATTQKGTNVLTISEKGYGKITALSSYTRHLRGGKGIRTLKVTPKTGQVAAALVVDVDEELLTISANGQIIRVAMDEISVQSRNTQGVMIIRDLSGDDRIVAVAPLVRSLELNEQGSNSESTGVPPEEDLVDGGKQGKGKAEKE